MVDEHGCVLPAVSDCLAILYSGGRDGLKMSVVVKPAVVHVVCTADEVVTFLKFGTVQVATAADALIVLDAVDVWPKPSVTVSVTVYVPAESVLVRGPAV